MQEFTEKKRVEICLLLAITIKQTMQETGTLRHDASVDYAQRAEAFFYETMEAISKLENRTTLKVVE